MFTFLNLNLIFSAQFGLLYVFYTEEFPVVFYMQETSILGSCFIRLQVALNLQRFVL